MSGMPGIDFRTLGPEAREWASKIAHKDGTLRATRPSLSLDDGQAAYVWRMVVFYVSPRREHQCMPVVADFWLPQQNRDQVREKLDRIVDQIVDAVPVSQWHGVQAWGRVL